MTRTRLMLRRLLATGITVVTAAAAALVATAAPASAATVAGIDVSRYQGSINWTSVRNAGIEFAFIKATEGTSYKDSNFNSNYTNAYYAGVLVFFHRRSRCTCTPLPPPNTTIAATRRNNAGANSCINFISNQPVAALIRSRSDRGSSSRPSAISKSRK